MALLKGGMTVSPIEMGSDVQGIPSVMERWQICQCSDMNLRVLNFIPFVDFQVIFFWSVLNHKEYCQIRDKE